MGYGVPFVSKRFLVIEKVRERAIMYVNQVDLCYKYRIDFYIKFAGVHKI